MITISKLIKYASDIKVLYVEDDDNIREEIRDFLGRFFPSIDLAGNGEEGLELYKNGNYDIVISDINMPKMNGIEMIHAIKEINEEQKIIVTSAYNEPKYLVELIDSGVDKFVLKPFNNKQFLLVLYKISEQIYNKKQNELLQEEIAKNILQAQTIVDMIEHGIIIIDAGKITQVNKQFLSMAGYENQEAFYQEIVHVSSLFEVRKEYISANSNKELIELLESKKDEINKVIMKKDTRENIYLLKCKKVPAEDKYVISFTDITEEEELINIDIKTGLPNRYAMTSEIEYRLGKGVLFVIDLVVIENIEKMIKWHGKDIRKHIDENVAKVLKKEKKELDEHSVFVSYYGHNRYVFVREHNLKDIVDYVINKISYISTVEDYNDTRLDRSNILYQPMHLCIDANIYSTIDNLLKEIEEKFDDMLL
ncbi:response regulator [Sulfurimonas sp.]|uniref:response regulator transcription factor n=1 Tax=Sulfurimonas sp. TaxID=2022749 RepID=UPI003569A1F5